MQQTLQQHLDLDVLLDLPNKMLTSLASSNSNHYHNSTTRSYDSNSDSYENEKNSNYDNTTRHYNHNSNASESHFSGHYTFSNPTTTTTSTTKIIAFADHGFRYVAANWYLRLQALGYTTHVIVAVDDAMVGFLNGTSVENIRSSYSTHTKNANNNPSSSNHNDHDVGLANRLDIRFEAMLRPPLPAKFNTHPFRKKLRFRVEQIFALRWKYILHQLKLGIPILMTDCDNIFNQYVDLSKELEQSEYDVYHAYETRYPKDVFDQQGFVVCGGMSWFRATPSVINFVRYMIAKCKDMCDDQVILNQIILHDLNMSWDGGNPYAAREQHTIQQDSSQRNNTDIKTSKGDRFHGLPYMELTGTSGLTGHRVKIWNREYAFRGPLDPRPSCPRNNWVSMPLFEAYSRQQVWMDKLKAFEVWDRNCGHVNNSNNNISFGIHYLPPEFHDRYNRRPMKLG